jgi:hypothetical protein
MVTMKIIGILLLLAGAAFLYEGINRQNSLVGHAATATANVENSVDGGTHTPLHVTYIVVGGVLMAVGVVLAFRSSTSP